ncbi:MFS transporter [Rhizobium sp. FY34]|uniref:MFS transporter n=1 Tax=Rhizobium sp. FY34 TaxID=2562309 RepID=UPI0010BF8A8B|nr:MFS transporter [Rhizobium sp. FY34]
MSDGMNETGGLRTAPGTSQGILLGLLSLVSVAASVLLAPVLPSMVAHFAPLDPHAETKVVLAMMAPALMVAVSSSFVGILIDKIGRRSVLIVSLLLYGLIGISPAFIHDLNILVCSRFLLGIFEAAIMVASTTLIGDYFEGKERQKWLIMQTVFVAVSGIPFILIGGVLGQLHWNVPFYVYGVFILAIPAALTLLREPSHRPRDDNSLAFPWRDVIGFYAIGLLVAILFLIVPIQLPFLLTQRGITSPLTISVGNMANSFAILVGSIYFRRRADHPVWANFAFAFAFIGVGLLLVVGTGNFWLTLVGAVLSGLGGGFILPAVVSEILRHLPFELRGRGTGRWQTSYFAGSFGGPLIVLGITSLTGALESTLIVMALVSLASALASLVALYKVRTVSQD